MIISVNVVGELDSPLARNILLLANVAGVIIISLIGMLVAYIIDYKKSYGLFETAKKLNSTLYLIFMGIFMSHIAISKSTFDSHSFPVMFIMVILFSAINSGRKKIKTNEETENEKKTV